MRLSGTMPMPRRAVDAIAVWTIGIVTDIDLAGLAPRVAADDAGHLGMAGSHRAVQRDDLAAPNAETVSGVGETSGAAEPVDGQRRRRCRRGACQVRANTDSARCPSVSSTIRSTVIPSVRAVVDDLPVAQHGDAVAELEDLVVAMAHEDDGDALGGQRPDRREQPGGIVGTQRRRRLVEDEDSRALQRQHLGDLDELALRLRQLARPSASTGMSSTISVLERPPGGVLERRRRRFAGAS